MALKYWHTMVRVSNLEESLDFYCGLLGLKELGRYENEKERFTLVFLATEGKDDWEVELTFNWDREPLPVGRGFGHLSFRADDIYAFCESAEDRGVTIYRPPHDGMMAFIKSPDGISIEILQAGAPLAPREPWASRKSHGDW